MLSYEQMTKAIESALGEVRLENSLQDNTTMVLAKLLQQGVTLSKSMSRKDREAA